MDGEPFQVRTFYFGCEDKSKKTVILNHGFMANIISYFKFLKLLTEHYRVMAYDNCNWGLNTRTADSPACYDPEKAEQWILSFHEQVINKLEDCPEKFFLVGQSHGGY